MAKRPIGREKAEEKTMVVCPNCGGREFATEINGSLVMSNVHAVKANADETVYEHEIIAIVSIDYGKRVLVCTDCQVEVILKTAPPDGAGWPRRTGGADSTTY